MIFARTRLRALAVCLFFLVVGARWAVCARYGTDVPQTDEWDGIGLNVLSPWSHHQLTFGSFWVPHVDHRIVLTRVLTLAEVALAGQWDQRVETIVNALLAGAIAVGWLLLAAPHLSRAALTAVFVLLALFYAAPWALENILFGFNSQQYLLLGLALITLTLLPFAEPFTLRWCLGAAAAVLSLGTMGSGFFAAGVAGAMLAWQGCHRDRRWAAVMPGLIVCAGVVAIGVLTRPVVPHSALLKARSISDFGFSLVKSLGWPAFEAKWGYGGLLLDLPFIWVAAKTLGRRAGAPRDRWAECLSGLGLWALAQSLATAYARGLGGMAPASRYLDSIFVALVVNALCLALLLGSRTFAPVRRSEASLLRWVWCGLLLWGLAGYAAETWPTLPGWRQDNFYAAANARQFLATGDLAYLRHRELPYPGAEGMRFRLETPELARLLPASIRLPLELQDAPGSAGFVRDDTRHPENIGAPPPLVRGVSPQTPVLENTVTWGAYPTPSAAAAMWRSQPIRLQIGQRLQFKIAGQLGQPGTELLLRDAVTGRVVSSAKPARPPGNAWHALELPATRSPLIVEARRKAGAPWFAFSQPVEISSLSSLAWKAARSGLLLAVVSGVAALLTLALPARQDAGKS